MPNLIIQLPQHIFHKATQWPLFRASKKDSIHGKAEKKNKIKKRKKNIENAETAENHNKYSVKE